MTKDEAVAVLDRFLGCENCIKTCGGRCNVCINDYTPEEFINAVKTLRYEVTHEDTV